MGTKHEVDADLEGDQDDDDDDDGWDGAKCG